MIAAFVVPSLILRDTNVLTITRQELRELTPTAKSDLEDRQSISHFAGKWAPYLAGALLLGGLSLIAVGVPRLRRQEETADAHAQAELDKLLGEMKPQTEKEKLERLQADLIDKEKPTGLASPPPKERNAETAIRPIDSPQLQRWSKAENEVLNRLVEIAPPRYDLQSRVKLEGASAGQLLLLDALLISKVEQLPDIVVEVKFAGKNLSRNVGNRMAEAESQLLRYLARYRRDSVGWLILYMIDELEADRRREIVERAAELTDILKVSVVTRETLPTLSLPLN
ncbi:MAG TPA: hypothetical protein VG898_00805 [Solirubrobacterales bacterium]|nr:hypothetical protein [Solirubrobacterales bacterium]